MKIDFHLSSQQLNALVFSFNALTKIPVNNRDVKVARSILDKVVVKFKKKLIEVQASETLFTKKKKYKFSLEYYEAHYLEQFVTIMDQFPMNEYDRNVLHLIKTWLNQKLT